MSNAPFDPGTSSPNWGGPTERPSGPRPLLDDEEGGLDLFRYLSALYRHKWWIVGLGVAGLVVGVVAGRTVEPQYESFVTLQIEGIARPGSPTTPIRTTQLMDTPRGWTDLMRSFAVLDQVALRRRLFVSTQAPADARHFETLELADRVQAGNYVVALSAAGDRVTLSSADGTLLDERPLGDSLGLPLGIRWVPAALPAGTPVPFRLRTVRDAAAELGGALQIPILNPEMTFLTVSLRGDDPEETAATLNAFAERFVELGTLLKREKLSTITEVLRAQLERSQADLTAADNELERFKVNTITLGGEPGGTSIASGLQATNDPNRQAYFRARLERDSLEQERNSIARALRIAPDSNTSLLIVLGAVPSARSSSELNSSLDLLGDKNAEAREMRLSYGPAHEPLKQLDREINELETVTIPQLARAVMANLDRRARDLDARIAASGREMQQIPMRVSEEQRLQRRVLVAGNLYTQLQGAYEQARLAELAAAPDVRLLDAARAPSVPVADQVRLFMVAGLAGGALLGAFLALLLDRFDSRIRYPEQITKDLGLNILGTLPMMRVSRRGVVAPDYASQLVESMRGIRTNLSYAHGAAGTFITTVTSPGPGDGKSFTSANLARAFAAAGRRTILIDADTRRGLLHHTLGVERRPGLVDLLDGTAPREQVIRTLGDAGIDFVPCGTRRAAGPELLASPVMAQFILGLRADYQAIIVDSPPLGAGVDPLVLASLCGSMVIVLRTGVTDRDLAGSQLAELHRLPIRLLGAILNDVSSERQYKYYGYLPGYRAEDEKLDEPKVHTPPAPGTAKRLSKGR